MPIIKNQIRQGDLMLDPVTAIPADAHEVQHDGILAYGEATGHSHRIVGGNVRYFHAPTDRLYLLVDTGTVELVHEEHGSHQVGAGTYEVVRKREATLDAAGWRQVAD